MIYLLLLPLLALANRLRGEEGWAGEGRVLMALLAAAPLWPFGGLLWGLVLLASFAGVVASHRDYFDLRTAWHWLGLSCTGMLYTAPAAAGLLAVGYSQPALAFLAAGAAKPLAYRAGQLLVGPQRDHLEQSEWIFGAMLGLGILPAYVRLL